MIISIGEKLHILIRRRFEEDIRRHFAGVVSAAEGYIANILPANAVIEDLNYRVSDKGNLTFTDNQQFSMVINEFGVKR